MLGSVSRKALCALLAATIGAPGAFAQRSGSEPAVAKTPRYLPADEFAPVASAGEVLVPVTVVGSVAKPGIYRVPVNTDLIRLVALAGGSRPDADLESVTIRRRGREIEQIVRVDFRELGSSATAEVPLIEAEDVVMIPQKEPIVSSDALQLTGIVASILSLVVSGLVIQQTLSK